MKHILSTLLFIFAQTDPLQPPQQLMHENTISVSTLAISDEHLCSTCNKKALYKINDNNKIGYYCQDHACVEQNYTVKLVFNGKEWGLESND